MKGGRKVSYGFEVWTERGREGGRERSQQSTHDVHRVAGAVGGDVILGAKKRRDLAVPQAFVQHGFEGSDLKGGGRQGKKGGGRRGRDEMDCFHVSTPRKE
jgi:hypothetical protein